MTKTGSVSKMALAAAALGCVVAMPISAKAEPVMVAGVWAACPLTGPGVAACAGIGLVLHEAVKAANGDRAFGDNGEVMRLLVAPVRIIGSNIRAANGESGVGAQILRGALGISVRDIDRHGLWGGPNSIFRKPFG